MGTLPEMDMKELTELLRDPEEAHQEIETEESNDGAEQVIQQLQVRHDAWPKLLQRFG